MSGHHDRCHNCDRVECQHAELRYEHHLAVDRWWRSDHSNELREPMRIAKKAEIEAARECRKHRVDWRKRCLAAEAKLEAWKSAAEDIGPES